MLDFIKGQYIEIGFEDASHYIYIDVESISVDDVVELFKKEGDIKYVTYVNETLGKEKAKNDKISLYL